MGAEGHQGRPWSPLDPSKLGECSRGSEQAFLPGCCWTWECGRVAQEGSLLHLGMAWCVVCVRVRVHVHMHVCAHVTLLCLQATFLEMVSLCHPPHLVFLRVTQKQSPPPAWKGVAQQAHWVKGKALCIRNSSLHSSAGRKDSQDQESGNSPPGCLCR